MKKYNFSIKRILSRLVLTGIVTTLFFIAMFPFLRVADGLLYEQRAAIGQENMWRIVFLWALFTTLFLFVTFWKKRFRMVTVFLIVFWVIGTSLVVFLSYRDNSDRCLRSYPYPAPKEIDRALDLIAQRLNVEEDFDTYIGKAFQFRNCLNIQYIDELAGKDNPEGIFLIDGSTLDNLQIYVKPEYQSYDDLTIATLLVHELTHVGQYINEEINDITVECIDSEAEAFTVQSVFLAQLNEEERRSIFARINEDVEKNPAFQVLLVTEEMTNESYWACDELREKNSLTELQFNECVWTGTTNKLKDVVSEDEYYEEQCREY